MSEHEPPDHEPSVHESADQLGLLRRPPHFLWAVLTQTIGKVRSDRVLGLAAEAGFWGIVSLPSLALSVFGGLGYLRGILGDPAVNSVRADVLRAAGDVLTPSTVNADVAPLLDQILARGHPEVVSIAFLVSLWSGSTCMADYVNTITVAYEMRGVRAWWRTRLRSLVLYLLAVVSGILILPALALGPNEISRLFPDSVHDEISLVVQILYIPVVGLGSIAVVAGLYHLALPRRVPWRRGLPGATLAVALWLSGSFGVRIYLTSSFHDKSVYGSLSAPIAALIFFYVTALAVLIGAEVNSAIDVVHARLATARVRRRTGMRRRLAERRTRRRLRQSGISREEPDHGGAGGGPRRHGGWPSGNGGTDAPWGPPVAIPPRAVPPDASAPDASAPDASAPDATTPNATTPDASAEVAGSAAATPSPPANPWTMAEIPAPTTELSGPTAKRAPPVVETPRGEGRPPAGWARRK